MNFTRDSEKEWLKAKIEALLEDLKISKAMFKRTIPRMKGSGYKWYPDKGGKKPSLRQKYAFLKELKASFDKDNIVEYTENKNEK